MPRPDRRQIGTPSTGQGHLKWAAECDTTAAGLDTEACAAVYAALQRASEAVGAAVALRGDLLIGVRVGGAAGQARQEGGGCAAAGSPSKWLSAGSGGSGGPELPQALARQLRDVPAGELEPLDGSIELAVPDGGFLFQAAPNATAAEGDELRPNFDAALLHATLHVLGVATAFRPLPGAGDPALVPEPLVSGAVFSGFAPLRIYDAQLVDTVTGLPLRDLWAPAEGFATAERDWAAGFRRDNSSSFGSRLLYNVTTTPGRVAFLAADGDLLYVDAPREWAPGRSLVHLAGDLYPAAEAGLFATAFKGPVAADQLVNTSAGYFPALSLAQQKILKGMGWKLCADYPHSCASSTSSISSSGGSTAPQPFPTWAIAVIAVVGTLAVALLVGFLVHRSRSRKWVDSRRATNVQVSGPAAFVARKELPTGFAATPGGGVAVTRVSIDAAAAEFEQLAGRSIASTRADFGATLPISRMPSVGTSLFGASLPPSAAAAASTASSRAALLDAGAARATMGGSISSAVSAQFLAMASASLPPLRMAAPGSRTLHFDASADEHRASSRQPKRAFTELASASLPGGDRIPGPGRRLSADAGAASVPRWPGAAAATLPSSTAHPASLTMPAQATHAPPSPPRGARAYAAPRMPLSGGLGGASLPVSRAARASFVPSRTGAGDTLQQPPQGAFTDSPSAAIAAHRAMRAQTAPAAGGKKKRRPHLEVDVGPRPGAVQPSPGYVPSPLRQGEDDDGYFAVVRAWEEEPGSPGSPASLV